MMKTPLCAVLCLALTACAGEAPTVDAPVKSTASAAAPSPSTAGAQAPAAPDPLEAKVRSMAEIKRARSPSFSPDGKRIAFVSDLGGLPELYVVPSEGGKPERVTSLRDPVAQVAWSPDGAWIAMSVLPGGGMNQQVYVIRPDGKDLRRLTDGGQENNWLGSWTFDGKALSLASNRRERSAMDAYLYDVAGQKLQLVTKNTGIGTFHDVSRDRNSALLGRMVSRGDDDLFLVDVRTGKEVLLTPHEGRAASGACSRRTRRRSISPRTRTVIARRSRR